ncbi:hypothetical protein BDK51DRAFT_32849 [Blyttiomyces helicus]|uniref:Uncharacterized protein n=1 Tax=Blyttiomyces helicus TaxID=388810 RepID=A0A4P9W0K6_9FUNG|nr:hypothetical protein BDK51DRAFT_32849 [Blyttiomyces helicus]|eukprot:RKO84643.1 hypothetical protein BDK51DRAFT_32849 [Blyttiomyces helicus]
MQLFAGFLIGHGQEKGRGAEATGPPLFDVYAWRKILHNINPNTAFAYKEDNALAISDNSIIHQVQEFYRAFAHLKCSAKSATYVDICKGKTALRTFKQPPTFLSKTADSGLSTILLGACTTPHILMRSTDF